MNNFKEKSPLEIQKQVESVNQILGVDVSPQSWQTLNKYEIKEKHKVRYDAYLTVLRELKKDIKDEEAIDRAREHVTMLNNLKSFIDSHQESAQDARGERHSSVYLDIQAFLEEGKTEGYVKLPTGVGKTVIFARLIEALGLKTFVVVPTKVLVEQTGERIDEFTDVELGKMYSEQKDTDSHVTITTYQSLVQNIKNGKLDPAKVPLLVLDEAHRALGDETQKALAQFTGLKIGFTATDFFSAHKNVSEVLSECVHSMSLSEAIREGALANTRTIHAFTEVDLSSVQIINGNYNEAELEKAINIESRNKAAVELYQKEFSDKKAVCYCSGVQHAKTLADLFNKSGISCASITQDTPKESRKEIFAKFKIGEIKVLCNANILIEGFDEDTCSVGFNLRPTQSWVNAEQRGGRPLRLDKNDPEKVGAVVDFIDKNSKRKPVLFSEILGGESFIKNNRNLKPKEKYIENDDEPDSGSHAFSPILIQGLRVVVDTKEILQVTREYSESREKIAALTYQELQAQVHAANIKSSHEYSNVAPSKGWPSFATLIKKSEFQDWDEFLGREKMATLNYQELQAEVCALGIKSCAEYENVYSSKSWPSLNVLRKKVEWQGLDEFLGRKKFNLGNLKAKVRAAGIRSSYKYRKVAPDKGWPSRGFLSKQEGFKSWDKFFEI